MLFPIFALDADLCLQLWNDFRTVVMPELARQVAYVPIPRIEYSDKALDLVIENLTLQGRNLFPNIFEVQGSTFMRLSPYGSIKDESHHTVTLTMTQIQADLRDCAFYVRTSVYLIMTMADIPASHIQYNKKSGFPKIKDEGLADVFLGGDGITIKVKIASALNDANHVFYVKDVNVKVDTLKFAIKDAKHSLLYKTLKPLATGLIKKQIAKAIGDGIRTGLEMLDTQLIQVRSRMTEAGQTESGSRTEALKSVSFCRMTHALLVLNSFRSSQRTPTTLPPRSRAPKPSASPSSSSCRVASRCFYPIRVTSRAGAACSSTRRSRLSTARAGEARRSRSRLVARQKLHLLSRHLWHRQPFLLLLPLFKDVRGDASDT